MKINELETGINKKKLVGRPNAYMSAVRQFDGDLDQASPLIIRELECNKEDPLVVAMLENHQAHLHDMVKLDEIIKNRYNK